MSNFEDRLSKAIERGQTRNAAREHAERLKQLTAEELKQLHTRYRLHFSEHIEQCVRRLPQHFPGFQCETVFGERGWGVACSRDDLVPGPAGRRMSSYSRLEMTIRPYSPALVVELAAKGTIRNKEIFNRQHFELVNEVDEDTFLNLIDAWVLEYAEQYAAVMG
jgi:hypothetical protein